MIAIKDKLTIDTWVTANWNEFIEVSENPAYQKARCYYYNGKMRIETMSIGPDHASQHGTMTFAINLFCTFKGIPHRGLVNCSYRKTGVRESQPDISYYLRERVQSAPTGSSVVDLDQFSPPNLAIEIADTTLSDDKGEKRLLSEELKVDEYWVVDVQKAQILAFEILADGGSRRIYQSQALPELAISVLEEALERSRQPDQSQVATWLVTQFQQV
ncbi:Uma2 family endonuclease [Microseira sp. BLCC-F43]|jgi:Uma2 family endonuclease|uniref:Uma2 family endonuclease n=1 Tax=Microseira sp. BLCC-F43 TaxID=3153602 RepID=UPI0035B7E82A